MAHGHRWDPLLPSLPPALAPPGGRLDRMDHLAPRLLSDPRDPMVRGVRWHPWRPSQAPAPPAARLDPTDRLALWLLSALAVPRAR
jgi:hypothetical protein